MSKKVKWSSKKKCEKQAEKLSVSVNAIFDKFLSQGMTANEAAIATQKFFKGN
jgi:hypothetical protein